MADVSETIPFARTSIPNSRKQNQIMNRRNLASGLVAGLMLWIFGCERLPTYRYRLTVEVYTPRGLRTGSSVIEVRNRQDWRWIGGQRHMDCRGQAAAVELGNGEMLFAVLRGEKNDVDWPCTVIPWLVPVHKGAKGWHSENSDIWAAAESHELMTLPRFFPVKGGGNMPAYPKLVRFKDIDSPGSLEIVDPDNLARNFGPGVKLKRITVQVTNDPVTKGIEKRFPWWDRYKDRYFDGTRFSIVNYPSGFSSGDFDRR